jgi:hypothetical protein
MICYHTYRNENNNYNYKGLETITINVLEKDKIPEELFLKHYNIGTINLDSLKGETIKIIQYSIEIILSHVVLLVK